jgi:hypothetical protein
MKAATLPEIVDLARYPIDDLGASDGQAFLQDCRRTLRRDGALLLPGFVRAALLPRLIAEAEAGGARARHFVRHFPYGDATDGDRPETRGLPPDDPRRFVSRTALQFVADDLIPGDSPLRALYEWPGMASFLAAVLGKAALWPRRDGLSGLNYTVMGEGDEQAWHYDESHFVTTILLQAPEAGGRFEYVRGLRGPEGDDLEGVKLAIAGRHPELVRAPLEPGTLCLFEGRFAFHRATPVAGPRRRLLALLAFDERPGVRISDELAEAFYARTAPTL